MAGGWALDRCDRLTSFWGLYLDNCQGVLEDDDHHDRGGQEEQ